MSNSKNDAQNQNLSQGDAMPKALLNLHLGEMLVEAGLLSQAQVDLALYDQETLIELKNPKRIGEIFVLRGWIDQQTVNFFLKILVNLQRNTLHPPSQYPIGYLLKKAGLLADHDIDQILRYQKKLNLKLKFGEIAVLQGLLKQSTVDFILKTLKSCSPPKLNSKLITQPLLVEEENQSDEEEQPTSALSQLQTEPSSSLIQVSQPFVSSPSDTKSALESSRRRRDQAKQLSRQETAPLSSQSLG